MFTHDQRNIHDHKEIFITQVNTGVLMQKLDYIGEFVKPLHLKELKQKFKFHEDILLKIFFITYENLLSTIEKYLFSLY